MSIENKQKTSVVAIEYGNADLKEILFNELKELFSHVLDSNAEQKTYQED